MTKYTCKYCDRSDFYMVMEIVQHAAEHTKKIELPSKALRHYRIEQT